MTASLRTHIVFDGPNIWASCSVTHFVVDAITLSESSPAFDALFAELVPSVHEGISLAPIPADDAGDAGTQLALLALNLQRLAGVPVSFFSGGPRSGNDGFDVVVQHVHPPIARLAAKLAIRIFEQLAGGEDVSFDLTAAFERFVHFNETCDGGAMGRAMRAAAVRRRIPIASIDPQGRLIELGTGRFRQRYSGRLTSMMPVTAAEIEGDKYRTIAYLRAAGLPVPEGHVARTLIEAQGIARKIGYPIVLKPLDMGDFIGVKLDIRSADQLAACFDEVSEIAAYSTGKVLVEQYLHGNHYRAIVVADQVVAVGQRLYPQVVGDGLNTITQLIELENTHPKRSFASSSVYQPIVIDEQVREQLAVNGWTLDDIPPAGQVVRVKSGSRNQGTIHIDVTDRLHPDNAALLCLANRVAGLPVAGIDFVMPDLAESMWTSGGGIIELNANTPFLLNLFPAEGVARDAAPAIIDLLFPPGQPVRIPVVAVMAGGSSGKICEAIAQALSENGAIIGLATSDGVTIGGTHYTGVDGRNRSGPRTVLNNPSVDFAVVEVDAESIVTDGLGFDACDAVVIESLSGLMRPDGRPVETVLLDALDDGGLVELGDFDATPLELENRSFGTAHVMRDRSFRWVNSLTSTLFSLR